MMDPLGIFGQALVSVLIGGFVAHFAFRRPSFRARMGRSTVPYFSALAAIASAIAEAAAAAGTAAGSAAGAIGGALGSAGSALAGAGSAALGGLEGALGAAGPAAGAAGGAAAPAAAGGLEGLLGGAGAAAGGVPEAGLGLGLGAGAPSGAAGLGAIPGIGLGAPAGIGGGVPEAGLGLGMGAGAPAGGLGGAPASSPSWMQGMLGMMKPSGGGAGGQQTAMQGDVAQQAKSKGLMDALQPGQMLSSLMDPVSGMMGKGPPQGQTPPMGQLPALDAPISLGDRLAMLRLFQRS
jgi:hypothetical protein